MEQTAEFVNHPLLVKDKLLKRRYQINIFSSCAKSNCLVVIPTGLGKTIVALLMSIHQVKIKGPTHENSSTSLNEEDFSTIILCAPTRPLVDQHKKSFESLTIFEKEELVLLTGQVNPAKREAFYKTARCIFTTPQTLQNDIISNRVDLNTISLVVFDEAHRASGNYAYNFIAKKYRQTNTWGKILALTASPGKNKEKIQEVMENLHLDNVEVRTEDDSDVKPYLHPVKTIYKDVNLPEEMKHTLKILKELKKENYEALKQADILDYTNFDYVTRKDLLVGGKKLDYLISQSQGGSQIAQLLYLKKIMANSMRVSHMSEVIETQGVASLYEYLKENAKKVKEGQGGKSLQELFSSSLMIQIITDVKSLIKAQISHPKIPVLMDLLSNQFERNKDSRILVFCRFRDTISNLVPIVNNSPLIKAHEFVGQAKKGKKKGMTQKDQIAILQQFKEGEYNTLIATNVAEEGLDISECDIVIFYDIIPSEIRTIQRRGRTGRSKAGTIYIIKTKGTREEGYFWAEKRREKEMKQVLRELQREKEVSQTNISKNIVPQKSDKNQTSLSSFMGKSQIKKITKESGTTKSKEISSDIKESGLDINKDGLENYDKQDIDNLIDESDSEPYILIDSRETSSAVVRILSELNVNIKLKPLPVGDYIVSKRVGIERKSIDDFISSIKDGRLFNELNKLKTQFPIPILLIEGDIDSIITIQRNAILGTLSSIMLNMNVYIYQTKNEKQTAEMLIALSKKECKDPSKKFSIRFLKMPKEFEKKLEYIVSGIPGINRSRAIDLLEHFNTIEMIFTSSKDDLMKATNIGPKTAENIYEYSHHPYKMNSEENS